jgi:choline dehydrogenase-like flavoprotein
MRGLGIRRTAPGFDSDLDAWIRDNITTAVHLCASAPMGPDGDAMAVVDQYCRVRGVEGLRVVDTSVLPTAPSRGPAATAVLIGERASQFFDGGSS